MNPQIRTDSAIAPGVMGRCKGPRLARRLGVAAFVFFLVKGLLWLAVPAFVWSQTR